MGRIWKILTRKKVIDPVTAEETRLRRSLNVFDLTALGIGSTLGVGVYVLAGQVAKVTAGPSVILSFLIAAIASVFAGLCYAEFGARAPRAGSAYIYSYVCVGEFVAFVIGWNLILEYVIGSASVARGLSLYLDTLLNNTLQTTFREIAPINVAYLASYFDFFSFGISILLAVGLAFGLKESSKANNVITCLNIGVVLFIIIAGSLKANPANWRISPNNTNVTNTTIIGAGGFFPWGVEGMIKGAATCFYGFVGFDCIATTGEEVKNPRKAIPVSIIVSLFVIFLAYFGVATVLTLMVPYYLQDYNAPIPRAFEQLGWDWAKWIVAIGALFGLCASLFGAMFPLPRIIYAMGSDGLVFRFLAKVHPRFQSPVIGTLLAGLLTGLMAALFDLSQLVNMMSIGTLQAYTIVAASVLLLRFKEEAKKVYIPIKTTSSDTESVSSESSVEEKYNDDGIRQNFDGPTTTDQEELLTTDSNGFSRSLRYIINCSIKQPNRITENIVAVEVLLYCLLCVGIGLCVIYMGANITNGDTWAIVVMSVVVGLTIIILISLMTQPKSRKELSFKVPLVPLIPALSILVNIYLMLMLDFRTWVRFGVWMAVGLPIYYICACQRKPLPLMHHQKGGNYSSNLTNGQAKTFNGVVNHAFVHTEPNGHNSLKPHGTRKKAAAPVPPTIYEQNEQADVQTEQDAIAQLDDILEKEAAIAQLDEVLNSEILNERKLSDGTLSNMSVVASHSEDVIADVHCADVSTPVADPKCISFPSVVVSVKPPIKSELVTSSNPQEGDESGEKRTVQELNISPQTPDQSVSNLVSVEKQDDRAVEVQPQHPESDSGIIEDDVTEEILDGDRDKPENLLITPSGVNSSEITKGTSLVKDSGITEAGTEKSSQEEPVALPPPPPPAPLEQPPDEPATQSPRPTAEKLKTVALRHVEIEVKDIEPTDSHTASDTNLKVGSKVYKDFISLLDNSLKRTPVRPPLYIPPKKNEKVVQVQIPVQPNEDVIQDNIDHTVAREKLKEFYETRNAREALPSIGAPRATLQESKSVDESLIQVKTKEGENEDLEHKPEKSAEAPFGDHKVKMADVFNSIRLKKLDDKTLKRRLSKSLGSAFIKPDDQNDHKKKMVDIFESIKARRRESIKKDD